MESSSTAAGKRRYSKQDTFYRLNRFDILLIGLILTGASGVLLFTRLGLNWGGTSPSEVSVYQAGRIIDRLDLKHDGQRSLADGSMIIEVGDGRIRVRESNCSNRICINAGWIEHPGEVIACVPNQVMIEIQSEKGSFLDAVVK